MTFFEDFIIEFEEADGVGLRNEFVRLKFFAS